MDMMNQAAPDDKARSFIALDMDVTREFRWDFRSLQRFEGRAKDLLKRHEVFRPGMALHTGYILSNFIRIADILEAAVAAACGIDGIGKKDQPSEAAVAIQGYLDRGGNLEKLQREVYRSYLVVNDPNLIGEWEQNIAREEEAHRIEKEKAEAKIQIAKLELAEDQKKIAMLEKASGNTPPESPT